MASSDNHHSDNLRLDGRTAIVTGASRGIGRALAIGLTRAGANVAVTARSTDDLNKVAALVEKAGSRSVAVTADITETGAATRTVQKTVKHWAASTSS